MVEEQRNPVAETLVAEDMILHDVQNLVSFFSDRVIIPNYDGKILS